MPLVLVDSDLLLSDPERFDALSKYAREQLESLSALYPDFAKWYESKVTPGLSTGKRSLLLRSSNDRLAGIAIVKNDIERKLCCLRVLPAFEGSGVGLKLFDDAFAVLGTDKPLLTVAEEQVGKFQRVFEHFNFEKSHEYRAIYRPNRAEYSYNGLLLRD